MNLTRSLIVTVLDLILMCGCEEAGEAARFGVDSANAKERVGIVCVQMFFQYKYS